jgi:hypothetical protein
LNTKRERERERGWTREGLKTGKGYVSTNIPHQPIYKRSEAPGK